MKAADELAVVGRHIEDWRKQHGGRGKRLPEELWNAAAGVARGRGVEVTARALRLSRSGLRQRRAGARRRSWSCA